MSTRLTSLTLTLLMATATILADQPMSPEELERWFEDDSEARALAVNEGELEFLAAPPAKRTPHSHNVLTIDEVSIAQGWVALAQCYDGLDPVAEAQVVYRYRQMRNLRVSGSRNIGRAWVEGESVQLQDVGHDAELCIATEVRVFYRNPDGSFSLINGPYHRKFLDGYYPLHVTLEVHYPAQRLRHVSVTPPPQPGLTVTHGPDTVTVDAWFEGMLSTDIRFAPP